MAINTTLSTASATALNKTFYDRQLLESASTKLVHALYGQRRSIPENNGKRVQFRRWELFDPNAAMNPLTEGVTPSDSQALSQSTVEAEVKQYGAYVEVSDLLSLTGFDQTVSDSAELLGEQIGTVIEWVTRDELNSGDNVLYCGGKASRGALTASDKLTFADVRKAVRTLKRAKARQFTTDFDGKLREPHYVCICSPEATHDLQSETLWQNVSAYSAAERIYSGEIGRMFGVVFVESTEAMIYKQSLLAKVESHSAGSADVVLDELTDLAYSYYKAGGKKVMIGSTEYTVSSVNKAQRKLTLSAAVASAIAANTIAYSIDAGAPNSSTKAEPDVHSTLIFGKDAYGVIDVAGRGALELIIKPAGAGGTGDPLDQRGTVGAKVAAYTAKILNGNWLVRVEHCVTA